VTGGGLTWLEQVEQCGGREQQGVRLWTSQGSPGPPFEVTIDWEGSGDRPIVAVLSRYSGVGSLEDPTGENTNGESGDCDDGDDDDTPRLMLTSTADGSVHVIGVNSRSNPIDSFSPGYTEITSVVDGSSGEKTTLTTFDQEFNPAATDTFQATIGHDRDWCTAGIVLSPPSAFGNAELLWVRSYTADDTVYVTIGEVLDQRQDGNQWFYFLRSTCYAWNPETYGCLDSELQLELLSNVKYDIVAWSEAENRVEPNRDLYIVGQGWRFHPGDINLDGIVNCVDTDLFWEDAYDWDLDGNVTQEDLDGLTAVVGVSMFDLDGNGVVDEADVEVLLDNWGPCPNPPDPCLGDLDCDGVVGVEDFLQLLEGP
jgi:hypothetical protein